jgi:hypothetical protein
MAAIIVRFAIGDEQYSAPIDGLYFNRRSSPTQPIHTAQWPCFALVVQGAKSLVLGDEFYRYGVGDYLVVSLDLPVVSRVTEASPEEPHLGLGMSINPERLKEVMRRTHPPRVTIPPDEMRGVAVNEASADLLDATLRLLRLLDEPDDIPAMVPLIEKASAGASTSGSIGIAPYKSM